MIATLTRTDCQVAKLEPVLRPITGVGMRYQKLDGDVIPAKAMFERRRAHGDPLQIEILVLVRRDGQEDAEAILKLRRLSQVAKCYFPYGQDQTPLAGAIDMRPESAAIWTYPNDP